MPENTLTYKIAVVDDHGLYRSGLVNLIHSLENQYKVTLTASNGREFLDLLEKEQLPDMVILDIDMPIMNGYETARELTKQYPAIPILVVTMLNDERSLIKMLRNGVKGYLSKDVEPEELNTALGAITQKGFHYTDNMTDKLIRSIQLENESENIIDQLNDKELQLLKLCCTESTYKEIADQMHLSPKTIDGYRGVLFEKLGVKSRIGLVIFAIKNGLVSV